MDAARGELKNKGTSLSRRDKLSVDEKPQWGRITPLKTLIGMLEKEFLMVPVVKETTPLLFPCSGVSLNLVPLTLERVNDHAPGVKKRLVHMRGLVTEGP